MYTFYDDARRHDLAVRCGSGKITAVVCHATCMGNYPRHERGTWPGPG
jgi:hypothetical protein